MKWVLSLLLLAPASLWANTLVHCDYVFMNVPMSSVEIMVYDDGEPASSVQVTMQGSTHKETATPEVRAADEFVHVWISKEKPENTIEMVVYNTKRTEGQSKIVNHQMPIAKEIWGECTGVPSTADRAD